MISRHTGFRCFRFCKTGGPPFHWELLTILDYETGEEHRNVIEANADRGWLKRYATDDELNDPDSVLTEKGDQFIHCIASGGFHSHFILHRKIEITYDPERVGDSDMPRYTSIDDIGSGVIYEENLSPEEHRWIDMGMPYCLCGRTPMEGHNKPCHRRDCREMAYGENSRTILCRQI